MTPDSIEIKNNVLTHSKLGIASCVIAVIVFIYFFVVGYISFYALAEFFKDSHSSAALGMLVISFFFHLAVCSVGFCIGLAFSLVSFITKDKKLIFPVTGLILNAVPLLSALILTIYFFYQ